MIKSQRIYFVRMRVCISAEAKVIRMAQCLINNLFAPYTTSFYVISTPHTPHSESYGTS